MNVEEMDLSAYPVVATQDPEGNPYPKPLPATNCWRVDYTSRNGFAKWEFYKSEISAPVAEIPAEMLRTMEKRMDNPVKITGVRFGMIYHQEEPGGPFVRIKPADKDPRAELFYEGDYTDKYMNEWRVKAYEGYFDNLRLTRGYSKETKLNTELRDTQARLKAAESALAVEKQNNELLRKTVNKGA